MIDKDDKLVFESSGAERYANSGIVGISPNGGTYTGYDDNLEAETFTAEEQIELAEHMIARWQKFLDEAKKGQRDWTVLTGPKNL